MPLDAILVVGGGLTGGKAVTTLREEGYEGRLTLVGDEAGVPFGRPPLSKEYLRGEAGLSDWLVAPEAWYAENQVELIQARAARLDARERRVQLADGSELRYDRLLLATGGRNRRPPMPGADLPGVYQLRTRADCDAIRAAARPGARALVVGMGFIGSEVAASLRALAVEVTAVFDGAAPLERVLGSEVASAMASMHRDHGVRLLPDDRVSLFEGAGRLERARTVNGASIECDLAVVAVGIQPNVELAEAAGLEAENGILVDAGCRTSAPDVWAAGDVANQLHPLFGRVRVEHYNNAERQGAFAARAMLGKSAAAFDYLHTFWSDQYEDKLEYVGHATKWDRVIVRGDLEARRFLGFYLQGGVLRAAVGINRGGDPELEPEGEMAAAAGLVRSGREVSEGDLA